MTKYFFKITGTLLLAFAANVCSAQFTHQDTLRGSVGKGRSWWNVTQYAISVAVDIPNKSISGTNIISFNIVQPGKNKMMQIDLQKPMEIEKIEDVSDKYRALPFKREGNVYWVDFGETNFEKNASKQVIIHFKGTPRQAVRAPWDGGWVWTHDANARPWVTVACQGLGASVWYPCKDYQGDEPDNGAKLNVTVPDSLVAVGNGRLKNKIANNNGTTTWQWEVLNPINNYDIVPYIGSYVNWTEKFAGEKGDLDCSYWVLDYDLDKSKEQFGRDVKAMLKCFEQWFGPYPFYEDSYKLVEAPHLGMEHQSAVAYGNKFKNGYLGMDLSGSGWGLKWDYIVVHESGHEWFGNNITTNDIADMWVHEGFTNYSEVLFTECQFGKEASNQYAQGLRKNIDNTKPIIGSYGVNKEGSEDMYAKGASMLHTIRQIINDDAKFKEILRGLNKDFYHKTVTSAEVEKYMSDKSGKNLSKIFDQYLRATNIPVLEWKTSGKIISYHWANTIAGFNMPVKLKTGQWITPGTDWKTIAVKPGLKAIDPDDNFYIEVKKL
jgi:aminopeptidase N